MAMKESEQKNICGANIKRYRELRKLSLEQCCLALKNQGLILSCQELSQLECGLKAVLDKEIMCYCRALSITVDQLFEGVL